MSLPCNGISSAWTDFLCFRRLIFFWNFAKQCVHGNLCNFSFGSNLFSSVFSGFGRGLTGKASGAGTSSGFRLEPACGGPLSVGVFKLGLVWVVPCSDWLVGVEAGVAWDWNRFWNPWVVVGPLRVSTGLAWNGLASNGFLNLSRINDGWTLEGCFSLRCLTRRNLNSKSCEHSMQERLFEAKSKNKIQWGSE